MRNPARDRIPDPLLDAGVVFSGYRSIVADPPWSFRDKGSRIAPDQRKKRWGRKGYRTMSLKEILDMGLEVKRVAARDAFLFLWTTSAHLLDGSAVLVCREWGFEPKTTIAWVKAKPMVRFEGDRLVQVVCRIDQWPRLQIGMGHYVRGSHELLVLARRGRSDVLNRGVPSVVFGPRGKHSEKPAAAYAMVERLADEPRLELFARSSRPGWTTWGDEAESTNLSTKLSTAYSPVQSGY